MIHFYLMICHMVFLKNWFSPFFKHVLHMVLFCRISFFIKFFWFISVHIACVIYLPTLYFIFTWFSTWFWLCFFPMCSHKWFIYLFLNFTLFLNLLGVWFNFSDVILLYFWCYFNSHMEFTHGSSLVKMHLHMLFMFTCKKTYSRMWSVRDFSVGVISFQNTYSLNYLYQSNKGRWEPRSILTKQSGFWL